jgi:hypothetical protein
VIRLLALLVVAHALCDYPLQGDFLARAKNHRNPIPGVPWYQALAAHAIIHAGAVWLITGIPALGIAEFACHWSIDAWKSTRVSSDPDLNAHAYNVDQLLHVLCKLLWVVLALQVLA